MSGEGKYHLLSHLSLCTPLHYYLTSNKHHLCTPLHYDLTSNKHHLCTPLHYYLSPATSIIYVHLCIMTPHQQQASFMYTSAL